MMIYYLLVWSFTYNGQYFAGMGRYNTEQECQAAVERFKDYTIVRKLPESGVQCKVMAE